MGIMGGVGQALSGIAQENSRAWHDQDLQKMRQEAEEQKSLRLLDASTRAGIMAHRENAQATADVAEAAAAKNRERVAGYGGDIDAATEAGDLPVAESIKKLNDSSLEEVHAATAKEIEKRGNYEDAMAAAIREGRGKNGTGGSNPLGQAKFDEQLVSNHIKENASFYTFTNDMDPTGKPQENLIAKQTYVGLVRKHGPDVADQTMASIMDEAQRIAADPKTGNIDQAKANAAYVAGISALRSQMGGSRHPEEPKPGTAPTSQPQPQKPAAKTQQVSAEDIGYSPDNETQFNHVMSNLSNPTMRAQAMSWLEGGGLSVGKRQQVERALR